MAYTEASLQEIRELSHKKTEDIRIGVSVLRDLRPLMKEIRNIRSQHKNWNLNVVSFDDEKTTYARLMSDLGSRIDCLFGLYSENRLEGKANVLHLTDYPICIAASVNHPLVDRKELTFSDLNGYSLIMVEKGDTPSIDAVRTEIETNYPEINLINVPAYDVSTFNLCAGIHGIMISVSLWDGIHPLLVNVPLHSDYSVPYGLIYARNPSAQTEEFAREITKIYAK